MPSPDLRAFAALVLSIAAALPAQNPPAKPSATPEDKAAKPQQSPVPAPLREAIPALQAQSSWEQNTKYEGPQPVKSLRGVYPVGNGKVFTYMGLGERANTMMALTGPTYAAAEQRLPRGHFGELTMDLEGVELPIQKVRRVTDANFVVTSDQTESGLALRTLTFAAPDSTTITRVIEVHNGTGKPARSLVLSARLSGGEQSATGNQIRKTYAFGKREYVAVFAMSQGEVKGGKLQVRIDELAAGASFTDVLTISTAEGSGKAGAAPKPTLEAATSAAQASVAWWKKKLVGTTVLRTDHSLVMDLFRDWKILMWTMRDGHSGVVSPMVTRRGAFIRESNGPILTFLRYNMWDEAKAILDYYYNAIRLTGEIRERYPLNLDFASLEGKETDWKKVDFPESDLLSWIVLQHFWYYRATWDAKFIEDRRSFLVECLSRQRRSDGALMRFSGYENWMNPTLNRLKLAEMKANPLLIAEAPELDRHGYSFSSAVLYLIAMQGMGDMDNGIDRLHNPKKWAVDPSEIKDKPSQKWLERGLPVYRSIESHFWVNKPSFPVREDVGETYKQYGDDWTGFFAPALSPVTREPHMEPVANANLLPLWVGFTFASGERSQHNLRNTLARLWHPTDENGKRTSALVGTTATVGHFTGDLPGMLLTALIERDARSRRQLHREVLEIAAPAGEWGQFYNPQGRPIATDDPDWPHRMSPNECGINLDACILALNGIRHVNVANFDNRSIKLKLRLPNGAKYLEMDNLKKDNREINVHVDEFWAPLNELERKTNDAQKNEKYKRDPTIDHRRFRFRMELLSENPPLGRYQVDADVSGTMFVRYAYRGLVGGKSGIIEETEFWKEDGNQFFLDGAATVVPGRHEIQATKGAKVLVLTNRAQVSEIFGSQPVTIVDTGLPMTGPELVRAILADGKPTHPTLFLDVQYDAADRRTFKRAKFWQHPKWKEALETFVSAGGKIVRPMLVTSCEVKTGDGAWTRIAAPQGRLQLPAGGKHRVRVKVTSDRERDDLVLRIGSGCGYKAVCDGSEVIAASGPRLAIRDQDASLLQLKQGENVLEFDLDEKGDQVLFVQISDAAGLPPVGLR